MRETVLEVRDLRVYYHLLQGAVKAVDGISFKVCKGEVLGVAGESGSGKTTLAMAIARLLRPPARVESGEVLFKGVNLLKLSEEEMRKLRGEKIAMIFQDPNTYLNPVYTAGFQVGEVYEAHKGINPKRAMSNVISLFRRVMMSDPERRIHAFPHQLSGGMKQRVLISMAIALEPELIIADEPTSALDVTVQAEIIQLLKGLQEEIGLSMMFVTHDLGLISLVSDRLMVMYAGKAVEAGPTDSVIHEPAHPYTKALLGALLTKRKSNLATIGGSPPSLMSPPPGCRFHPRCPHATDACKSTEPVFASLGEGHSVACLLYGGRS